MDIHTLRRAPLAALVLLALAQGAHAGATIMDDDLFPMNAIPASVAAAQAAATRTRAPQLLAQVQPQDEGSFGVPFRKSIWGLNDEGSAFMTELLPLMEGKKIVVIGRPDAVPNSALATQRSNYLRSWLVRHGIPANQIETRINDTPGIPIGGLYPVDIQILGTATPAVRPALAQAPTPMAMPKPAPAPMSTITPTPASNATQGTTTVSPSGVRMTVAPLTQPAQTSVAIIATPNPDVRLDMVRQIAAGAMAGRIDPKAAIATIVEILSNSSTTGAGPTTSAAAVAIAPAQKPVITPAPRPDPAAELGLTAAPETARPKEWLLSSTKTLKENVAEWGKKEGYEVDWRATNYFKVSRNSNLTGDILETVDRVTSAAGLDMAAWKKDRLIRICDKTDDACKRPQHQ